MNKKYNTYLERFDERFTGWSAGTFPEIKQFILEVLEEEREKMLGIIERFPTTSKDEEGMILTLKNSIKSLE